MVWWKRILGVDEQRALDLDAVFGEATERQWTSMSVANEQALGLVPVYASVSLIADQYSALPVDFFRKQAGFRLPVDDPEWWGRPDPRVSLYDWKHQLMTSLLLRGNAYGLVIRTPFQKIGQVIWIAPSKVRVDETGPTPIYYLDGSSEPHIHVAMGGDILHIPAFVVAGSVVGLSPVTLFRRQLEMHRSALMTGHDFYEGRAVPAGLLKNSQATLNAKQADEASERMRTKLRNGGVLTLDKNWSWEAVSLSAADAAFLTAIGATANQIAAIFRVDPEEVGGTSDKSLKYTTVEGNQRKFNNRTLLSWTVRVEYALPPVLEPDVIVKHNLDALARPNLLELVKAIREELNAGTLTLAEARALRDRVPLTDEQIEQWQKWYATTKSQSESDATSLALVQPTGD